MGVIEVLTTDNYPLSRRDLFLYPLLPTWVVLIRGGAIRLWLGDGGMVNQNYLPTPKIYFLHGFKPLHFKNT